MRFRTILDLDLLTKQELDIWGERVLFQHLVSKAGKDYADAFIIAGYALFFVTCKDEQTARDTYNTVRNELGHYKIH